MDIKGEITGIKVINDKNKIFTLRNSSGLFKVIGNINLNVQNGNRVSIINLEKKKKKFKTVFETTERTLAFLEPNIFVRSSEIQLSKFCSFAPVLASLLQLRQRNEKKELLFYRGIRGENSDNRFSQIASRYSKELRGKFSFKQFIYDKKTGFLLYNVLHFGKFPVVFSDNREKGEILALSSEGFRYVTINTNDGTLQEKKVNHKTASEITNKRNKIVEVLMSSNSKNLLIDKLGEKCQPDCPLYVFCKEIANKKDKSEILEKYLFPSLKKELKFRKAYLKTISSGNNPLSGSVPVKLKSKNNLKNIRLYNLGILSNEAFIRPEKPAIITERPPLDRKTIVFVKEVSFKDLEIKSEIEILTPELISPIPETMPVSRGLFDLIYSDNSSLPYLMERSSTIDVYEPKKFIENDELQNEAVNKIINMHGFFSLSGEHGTGKKYVLKKVIFELVKYGKTFLVLTQNKKKEVESTLKPDLDEFGGSNNSIKIYSFDEKELYYENPSFDYTAILTEALLDKTVLKSLMGKSKNIIFITAPDFIPFEERIPESNRARLKTEHRFGEHILHFLQPILSDNLESTKDKEIKLPEPEKAETKFKQILEPSKFVLYVSIKGEERGINNIWNETEAEFAVLTAKEFAKTGIKHSQIEIIVPYERQKKYIKYLLEKEKIGQNVKVALPSEAMEKDIVIISLTSTKRIGGEFADSSLLKIALTRARSKIVITGYRGVYKTSKLLSRIL